MQLADLAAELPARIQARGDSCWREGRVVLDAATGEAIQAVVRGTESYRARIERENGMLRLGCSCPWFATAWTPPASPTST